MTTLQIKTNNSYAFRGTLLNLNEISLKPAPEKAGGSHCKDQVGKRDAAIMEHVNSFNPEVSHYRREHVQIRKYLPKELTISFMHNNYLTKNPTLKCSYEKYRSLLTDTMNISFTKLGHEECEQCEEFDLHQ